MLRSIYPDAILVTRESARQIQGRLAGAFDSEQKKIILDFKGIAGMAPSFFDELLGIVIHEAQGRVGADWEILILNPPTPVSSKFTAVSRIRGLVLVPQDLAAWVLRPIAGG